LPPQAVELARLCLAFNRGDITEAERTGIAAKLDDIDALLDTDARLVALAAARSILNYILRAEWDESAAARLVTVLDGLDADTTSALTALVNVL
jgi:hypothetical protein